MSEIYTKTVVNQEIKVFFSLVSKKYFAMFELKLFKIQMSTVLQPTQALTQFGMQGIDFINYKEFHITGNKKYPCIFISFHVF